MRRAAARLLLVRTTVRRRQRQEIALVGVQQQNYSGQSPNTEHDTTTTSSSVIKESDLLDDNTSTTGTKLKENLLLLPTSNTNRIQTQDPVSLAQKGWTVSVHWKSTNHGTGVFAAQTIKAGTCLRRGVLGQNLVEFKSLQDLETVCEKDPERIAYVKDYVWGFDMGNHWFYGMWIPGNGLNHSSETANTIYSKSSEGIDLYALTDIHVGDELLDDYRRHGRAPDWLLAFAAKYQVNLNFADCNDFVK
jgi:hypothetical protein